MKKLCLIFLLLSLSIVFAQEPEPVLISADPTNLTAEQMASIAEELGSEKVAEIKANAVDCLNNVNNCDCSEFQEEGQAYCDKIVTGVMACLSDFSKPACQSIDPTKIVVNGVSLDSVVRKKVLDYDVDITNCVKGTSCDCSVFPVSIQEFCNDKMKQQTACLDDYDLEACMVLDSPQIKIFPDFTPDWLIAILDPIIRPLVLWRQQAERDSAIGGAMSFLGQCFADPYNCDCSPIKYSSIRADCMQRARLMKSCLEYRDCMLAVNDTSDSDACDGRLDCVAIVNMPLVPEVTPEFMKSMIEPVVLQNACPMMEAWPYDKGNYAVCDD